MADVDRLARAARAAAVQVAVAESLTSGQLASMVGAGEDAGEWFRGGVVAYQLAVKQSVLGVAPDVDPCSPECARQLAVGVRALLGADVAVSVTGVGGPEPEGGHAPGTVYIGWSTDAGTSHRLLELDGTPEEVLQASVDAAVEILVELVE